MDVRVYLAQEAEPSVAQQRRAPGKPATEGFQQQQLAALHATGAHRFVQRQRHRGRRRVAMAIYGDDHLLHRQLHPLGSGFDDAQVGLMRNQPIQVVLVIATGRQGLIDHRVQRLDRILEDVVALHQQCTAAILAFAESHRDPHRVPQQLFLAAIGVQMGAEDAGLFVGLEDHRAGAIAEQHAGGAIGPVDDAGQGFCANHQHGLGVATAHELVGHAERVDKTRACSVDVHRTATDVTQSGLQQTGGRRKDQVRGGGADDDQIDLIGGHTGRFHRPQRGEIRQIAGGLVVGDDVTFTDASAREDPFIAGVDNLRHVVVGQHLFGQITTRARDSGIDPLAHTVPYCKSRGDRRLLKKRESPGRAERGGRHGSIFLDGRRLGRDHLLAAVVTVSGDVVAQMDLAAGRVGRQLLGGQGIVRTTLAAAGRGDTGFLHSHGIAPTLVR
ncbi:hypothetical protein XAC2852_230020 [Xanthomonas citri pv. citri]|nr:hypothetical protein XAC2852_230020 [Xanthomonas citri pv. citri]